MMGNDDWLWLKLKTSVQPVIFVNDSFIRLHSSFVGTRKHTLLLICI